MKTKGFNITVIIINLLTLVAIIFGFVANFVNVIGKSFFVPMEITSVVYLAPIACSLYGLSSLVIIIMAIVSLKTKDNYYRPWFMVIRLILVSFLTLTIGTFVYMLIKGSIALTLGSLLHCVIAPALAIISFLFGEIPEKLKFRHTFWILIPVALYIGFYLLACFVFTIKSSSGNVIRDWYGIVFKEDGKTVNTVSAVACFGIFLAVSYLVSVFVWLLNRIFNLIIVGYDLSEDEITETPSESLSVVVDEPASEEEAIPETEVKQEPTEETSLENIEPEPEEKVTEIKQPKKAPAKRATQTVSKFNSIPRTYHISRSKIVGNQWQVTLAGGDKAIKLFNTQAEAINYAKGLVQTQGGSIRIHSTKGHIRKG